MHFFIKKIGKTIRDKGLLAAGERCVVAVSGGPDSMALLAVLARLAPDLGVSLVVAHVDHGLRPREAEEEVLLVREAARKHGLVCECARVEVAACAREQGLSREHAARNLRYGFLEEVARRHGATKIAVAHTADDQAEGILLRLIRGTGRAGLAGMAGLRDGLVVRPFLGIAKKEILRFLADQNITSCLDSSNLKRIYLRNRIRLDLLPYLQARFNPSICISLRETAAILEAEEELLVRLAAQAYVRVVEEDQDEFAGLTIALVEFSSQPLALKRRIVESACWRMGCRPSFRQIGQLLALADTGAKGAGLHLAGGLRVMKAEGRLRFCYPRGRQAARGNLSETGREAISFAREILKPGEYLIESIGTRVELRLLEGLPPGWREQGPAILYCDAEKVSFPLEVRSFRAGDRFYPLGAPGRKKLGDFFTDQKIPADQRNRIPVLTDQKGIVAILGLRLDQRAAITPGTGKILALSLYPPAINENGFTGKMKHGK
jgi:tRNA(Ile)-lysidine synthase